jgi:hypothetical protein
MNSSRFEELASKNKLELAAFADTALCNALVMMRSIAAHDRVRQAARTQTDALGSRTATPAPARALPTATPALLTVDTLDELGWCFGCDVCVTLVLA